MRLAIVRDVRWLLILVVAACGDLSDRARYLEDRELRRAALAASLVTTANDYAQLRLASYGASWDELPVWNPTALPLDASPDDPDALRALGAQAFARYPVQTLPRNAARDAGALVRVAGIEWMTCATCHASGAAIDLGWGPGRLDVTTPDGREVVKIPDLRAVRYQRYLHADANVRQRDLISLAVRIETLIITSHHAVVRPPPLVALALAEYIWSLAPPPSASPPGHGAELFGARCAHCHAPPDYTGEPVALALVGTDPIVGLSRERGTGTYRVPSLRGVGTRSLLLHDGSVHSITELLDPARTAPGHRFGTSLSAADRADLAAFVSTL